MFIVILKSLLKMMKKILCDAFVVFGNNAGEVSEVKVKDLLPLGFSKECL